MSDWKVLRAPIEIFEHPNAESLELGKIGSYQVVVQKGLYTSGDVVLFVPEKSVLPDWIADHFREYLGGKEKNRVRGVRLRGEPSLGIIVGDHILLAAPAHVSLSGENDLAETLGITKYEPPVPTELAGEVASVPFGRFSQHDVEQLGVYRDEFSESEDVVITEKVHGSQVVFGITPEGTIFVSSKGLFSRGLTLRESDTNAYWRAVRSVGLEESIRRIWAASSGASVALYGEVYPVQGGNWTYGAVLGHVTMRLFDVRIDGVSLPLYDVPYYLRELWVPVVYEGKLGDSNPYELCRGTELVSGKNLHIREGIVIRPKVDRFAKDGTRLMVKVINPKYKESGEEFN